jgi:hypothetical protein
MPSTSVSAPCVSDPAAADARTEFTYVLPISALRPRASAEFDAYLSRMAGLGELIIVDGSPPEVFAAHHRRWSRFSTHVAPLGHTVMGKVANVMTGVRLASHERVVVADDDVRFGPEITELVARLDHADVVRPQNFFDPLPWHAVWDSGRALLNRVWGGDWPGTLALRRTALLSAGGYCGDVMFENYELVETLKAAGGRAAVAPDLYVRRLPPDTGHFFSQRVRQAYDELARPARLVPFLAVVPTLGLLVLLRRWTTMCRGALCVVVVVVAVAEGGRRRADGRTRFPVRCSLAAPCWVAERSVCAWLAVGARLRGGVRYRGRRIPRAALRPAERRRRISASGGQGGEVRRLPAGTSSP